ncbi:MAG: hypothetical protein V1782_06780, partial [Pseudomonadota bacterium]
AHDKNVVVSCLFVCRDCIGITTFSASIDALALLKAGLLVSSILAIVTTFGNVNEQIYIKSIGK